MNEEKISLTEETLPKFVTELLATMVPSDTGAQVIALRGDLGAGKTTLVKALGAALGVSEHITSPTFTILKQYDTTNSDWEQLIHMDAYRIEDLNELGPLGFSELLKIPRTLFCIEWAEKIAEALPENRLELTLENTTDEKTRTIQISR